MPLAAIDVAASPKKTYAVHVDHLNRPIMLTDATKVNVWWASFEPFGKVRTTGGTLTQNLGLPGQWFQLESGLAHNWHRHYDPTTGRYTTADPLGFVDGPSVYAYAGNVPHVMVDPMGLQSVGGPGKNFTPRPSSPATNCALLSGRLVGQFMSPKGNLTCQYYIPSLGVTLNQMYPGASKCPDFILTPGG
jgi:RHS repeat-associated protein